VRIGVVEHPEAWEHFDAAKAHLEPARKFAGFDEVWEPYELLWAVMDGGECIAAATTWLGDGYAEVKLVGGRDYRRWLAELDQRIGACAREAGATRLQANGRAGWRKALKALGWDSLGEVDGATVYCREI
jgi:hypothetical protein